MEFHELNGPEVAAFKRWARDNYKSGSEIKGIWHPVVQQEYVTINLEHATFQKQEKNNG